MSNWCCWFAPLCETDNYAVWTHVCPGDEAQYHAVHLVCSAQLHVLPHAYAATPVQ
jgi:hypothetical protein